MIIANELTKKELNISIRQLEKLIESTKNMVKKSKNEIMDEALYKKLNQFRHCLTICLSERYKNNLTEQLQH
jgi:hypothetical protein|tara:strand:+ start:293 stop:508 length:216 start_codon:yes stop_codon:yes gene_type:complete